MNIRISLFMLAMILRDFIPLNIIRPLNERLSEDLSKLRSNGVGFKINEFFSMFDTTSILAYTLVFVFIIMSIEWFLVKPIEKKLTEWRL